MLFYFKGVGQVQSGFCSSREASLCGGGRQSDQHQGLHPQDLNMNLVIKTKLILTLRVLDSNPIAGVPWNGVAIARTSAGWQALDWPRTYKQGWNSLNSCFYCQTYFC